jgi:hypothetical protein
MCSDTAVLEPLLFFRWLKELQQRCVSLLEWKSLQREPTTTCSGCFVFGDFSGFCHLAFFWVRRRCLQLENDLHEVRVQLHQADAALVSANLQADTATAALVSANSRADTAIILTWERSTEGRTC